MVDNALRALKKRQNISIDTINLRLHDNQNPFSLDLWGQALQTHGSSTHALLP